MANYGGGAGGHTGPYWRRQTGTTLPGERTAAQLNEINAGRRKIGIPELGGKVGDNTSLAASYPGSRYNAVGRVKPTPILSNLAHQRVASTHGRGKSALRMALSSAQRRAIFNG